MQTDQKKVLYLSYDGLTDPLGQSQVMPYVQGLSHRGYSFTVISFEKQERYRNEKTLIQNWAQQYRVHWLPQIYHRYPPVLSTVYDLLILWWVAKKQCKEKKFQIVHCRSYLTSLVGLQAKKKWGAKFIFDMRGFWADERVEGGLWNLQNPLFRLIYSFFKKQERVFLEKADGVISLTHAAKNYIINEFSIPKSKVSVVPCSVDFELFNPAAYTQGERALLRTKLGIASDDFVLLYLGSLGTWYQYAEMVSAFEELKQNIPNAKFLFVTPDIEKVEQRPDFIVASVKRGEVPLYCTIANASIMFIKPSFSKMASSATKMAEVMAMGLPVITNKGWGDTANLADYPNVVCFVITDLIAGIERAGQKSINFALKNFSLAKAVGEYARVYEELVSANKK